MEEKASEIFQNILTAYIWEGKKERFLEEARWSPHSCPGNRGPQVSTEVFVVSGKWKELSTVSPGSV